MDGTSVQEAHLVMTTNNAGSPDQQLHSDTDHMTIQESTQLLSKVCERLSTQTTPEMVATALDTNTQEMVQTQLIPSTFQLYGLTTPLSVIVGLLLHCFLLSRDLQEAKGQKDEEVKGQQQVVIDLQEEVRTLKQLYEGVRCVNQQWALDYEKLQQQIADTKLTGFTSPTASHCHGDVLMSPSSERCFECFMSKSGLRERLERECEGVRRELKELKSREEVLKKERDQAINENRAIQYQLQELGDLRAAMRLKEEYPKRVQEIKNLKRQHQEEICARIKLEKQIERLRRVFSDLFPVTPTKPESGRGHITYPPHLRPCHTHQQYYSDPGPPTPPGLIARGQLTSLVERDIQSLSQRRDEQVTGFERPLVRLDAPSTSRQAQERWASDPHLNIERTQLVNGHTHSLAPPPAIPLRSRSFKNRRPRSLFDERSDIARSLVDVRSTSDSHGDESINQLSLPEEALRSMQIRCPGCGELFHRSQVDSYKAFEHIRKCAK